MRLLLLMLALLALPLAAYSNPSSPNSWPEDNQRRFLASCSEVLAEMLPDTEARQAACRCALETLQRMLPWAELQAKKVSTGQAVEAADEAFRACITSDESEEI